MGWFSKKNKTEEVESVLVLNADELHAVSQKNYEASLARISLLGQLYTKKAIEEINSAATFGSFEHWYYLDYSDKRFTQTVADNLIKYGYKVELDAVEIRALKISW